MRTIRVEMRTKLDATSVVTVSTEVVIGDDGEAADAGREARDAIESFVAGYAEGGDA